MGGMTPARPFGRGSAAACERRIPVAPWRMGTQLGWLAGARGHRWLAYREGAAALRGGRCYFWGVDETASRGRGWAGILYTDLAIFSGRAHPELAESIAARIGRPLGKVDIFEFSNENVFVQYQENIRQRDVYIVQPFCTPVNTSIMELLIMIDAAKRASAGRVTAVVPYFAYGRSDKKDQPRVPITARLLAT